MGTLLSLMNSSLTALQADQAAMNATSNNVANQNTVGYTREIVQFTALDSVTVNGSISNGVTTGSGAVSVRDRVLEQRVQQQTQTSAESTALESAWQQIEGVFSISATSASASSTALGSALDAFSSSLTSLAASPTDTSTRQNVLATASNLASAFNSAASQLAGVQSSLNQQVVSVTGQVNALTTSIAKLNSQIASLNPTSDAGPLEDQRQAAIAQLSQFVGVDQITTDHNGLTLTAGDGQVLVSGGTSFTLGTAQVGGNTHLLNASGVDITSSVSGGQLGGMIEARDTSLPTVTSALDTLANAIATNVNHQNGLGLDGTGAPGGAIFSGATAGTFTSASLAVATTNPGAISAAATTEGTGGNTNALALAALSNSSSVSGTTPSNFYASLLSQIGNAASSATTDSTQQQATLTQLTTLRDTLSGVSLDHEAANLTQYQRSYEAAARVFSIVNTLMADSINLGQQVAVA